MVDETDLCHLGGFPCGVLKDVFGIWNEEIDTLMPDERYRVSFRRKKYDVIDYCESIHARGAFVLAEYSDGFFAGSPALTVNAHGSGKAYYQAFRDDGTFANDVIFNIVREVGIKANIPSDISGLPCGITAHTCTDGENEYLFIENYSGKPLSKINLGGEFTDMITGKTAVKADISAYGFFVGKRKV